MLSPFFWVAMGEYQDIANAFGTLNPNPNPSSSSSWALSSFFAVALSCLFGLAISFFGFAARKAISATAFTVTGVVNKLLTVVINVVIWDKHASFSGSVCLLFTIVGGVLYQQSTTSSNKLNILQLPTTSSSRKTDKDDEEAAELPHTGGSGDDKSRAGDETKLNLDSAR
jgi:GDP-mannose transporter